MPAKVPDHIKRAREEAAAWGDKFFQGLPCCYGHDGIRYVKSGACRECQRNPGLSLNKVYQERREQARVAGKTRYLGKPYKHGHSGERWVRDSTCIECQYRNANVNDNRRKAKKQRRITKPEYKMWEQAKYRAGRAGLDFDIEPSDIIIPQFCPLLGIQLTVLGDKRADGKPSLDRIDNSKGYVKGNVAVVSYRANILKRDIKLVEAEALAANLSAYMQHNLAEPKPFP